MGKRKLLELFCGTKSMGKEFEKLGWEVTSIDIDPQFDPDICIDIRDWEPDGYYDVIHASPPCTWFTVAAIFRNWERGGDNPIPKSDGALLGIELVEKTLDIINKVRPAAWFMENPMGMMRKLPQVKHLKREFLTYCQYGFPYQKPTDFWHNTDWVPRPPCKRGAPCHAAAPRGSTTGAQGRGRIEKGIIPPELCREIAEYCCKIVK